MSLRNALATSPVVQSPGARVLFLASAAITAGILLWSEYFFPGRARLSPIFQLLFSLDDMRAASWTLAMLILAVFLPWPRSSGKVLGWISNHVGGIAIAVAVLLSAGTCVIYMNHPLAMDEYAPYLQSQVFAAGRLSGQFPLPLLDWLVPGQFQNFFITVSKSTGAIASGYWPSFALLLTPFMALGIPWACNPVISALTLLVVYRLALKMFDSREAAAWAVLLTAASPEFFINGITYYSMPAHLLANALFALLLLQEKCSSAFLAGVVGSIALTLHNPLPHILFALPWIVWTVGRRGGLRSTLSLAAGYLPLCLLIGLGWFWFTGHLRHSAIAAAADSAGLAGMWRTLSVFSLPDSSAWLARIMGLAKVWIWAIPGLLILAIAGARKCWSQPAVRLMAFSALLTLAGYIFVPVDQGHGWGYRYFHSAWIALPLLAAPALVQLGTLRTRSRFFEDEGSRRLVVGWALLMLMVGGTVRAVQVHDFMHSQLAQQPAYRGTEPRVILLYADFAFYGDDLVQNDPWLRNGIIRMKSLGRARDMQMLSQNFPDLHQVYVDRYGSVWSKSSASGQTCPACAKSHYAHQ